MYKGKKPFTKEQAVFVVEVILQAALDRIESGAPTCIAWEDRLGMLNEYDKEPKELTAFERGAIESAGMSLGIFAAQLTDEGLGVYDALAAAGKFDKKCEKFIKACWEKKGRIVKERIKTYKERPYQISKVLPEYPDCRKAAETFVETIFANENVSTD
jgi:hypothetical protein